MNSSEAKHYLKLLRDNGSFFQEDVRDALDFAISTITINEVNDGES